VDPRFVYRQYDVPAASHQTLAALLAWVADPQPGEVVWDPFCGSASELVECGLRTKGLTLVGSDRVEDAVLAARANLSAAGLDGPATAVHQCDALSSAMPGVDAVSLIITNPPMGHRVGSKDAVPVLLAGIVQRAAKVLAPGGRLVWLSPVAEQTADLARTLGLDVTDRGIVDLGGLSATLQVLRKPERSA
ncbi:MAG: methyltransferase, partial [Nannocystaceae bacterium]|nr:methyltransferase [Nannocystaceae bacterium]